MKRQADFSGILGETFSIISDTGRSVLIFVLVIGGLGALGAIMGWIETTDNLVSVGGGVSWEPGKPWENVLFELIVTVASFVASYLLLAEFLAARGRLKDRSTRIWAYVGMTILTVLGLIVGFVLLIIPGLILLVRWSAASGFLIGEREGIVDSLSASWDSTSGKGWSIFGAGLVLLVGLALFAASLQGVATATGEFAVTTALSALLETFGTAMFLAFGVAVFVLVTDGTREIREVFN